LWNPKKKPKLGRTRILKKTAIVLKKGYETERTGLPKGDGLPSEKRKRFPAEKPPKKEKDGPSKIKNP